MIVITVEDLDSHNYQSIHLSEAQANEISKLLGQPAFIPWAYETHSSTKVISIERPT